jgi:hypothetical protein
MIGPVSSTAAPRHKQRRGVGRAALSRYMWPLLSGGCHLGRETDRLIEVAGFTIERCERLSFRIPPLDPPKTHALGIAHRRP